MRRGRVKTFRLLLYFYYFFFLPFKLNDWRSLVSPGSLCFLPSRGPSKKSRLSVVFLAERKKHSEHQGMPSSTFYISFTFSFFLSPCPVTFGSLSAANSSPCLPFRSLKGQRTRVSRIAIAINRAALRPCAEDRFFLFFLFLSMHACFFILVCLVCCTLSVSLLLSTSFVPLLLLSHMLPLPPPFPPSLYICLLQALPLSPALSPAFSCGSVSFSARRSGSRTSLSLARSTLPVVTSFPAAFGLFSLSYTGNLGGRAPVAMMQEVSELFAGFPLLRFWFLFLSACVGYATHHCSAFSLFRF